MTAPLPAMAKSAVTRRRTRTSRKVEVHGAHTRRISSSAAAVAGGWPGMGMDRQWLDAVTAGKMRRSAAAAAYAAAEAHCHAVMATH